ncbi:cell wall anchor protein [Micromonospora sp. URMC 103]|uniref:cell wall anchor protein n=1 Tax=Micromonospora sp. URMC 103 TaxID=3423406 RepID=UPI003F1990A3
MRPFHRSTLARAGAVALLATVGLTTVAGPAHAEDQAELALTPLSYELAKGVKQATAKPFKFQVGNTSGVDAEAVTVTVNTKDLDLDLVGVVVPDGCEAKKKSFTCLLGDLAAGTTEDFGIPVFAKGQRGEAGTMKVTISAANAKRRSVDHAITVAKRGYDLTTWVQDVQANVVVNGGVIDEPDLKPVPRGETVPLDWAIYNDGSRKATGIAYGITLPPGVTFAHLPVSCVEADPELQDGPAEAYCEDPGAVLSPGQYYTDDVRVTIGADVTEPVLRPGFVWAAGLESADGPAKQAPRIASGAQRKAFTEVDPGDNIAQFDVFVDLSAQPSPTPTPTPTGTPTATPTPGGTATPTASATPGAGGGGAGEGGLPVTGVQVGLIGGIGAAVLLAGGALLLVSRRRKVVLVAPGDEQSTD